MAQVPLSYIGNKKNTSLINGKTDDIQTEPKTKDFPIWLKYHIEG